MVAAGDEITSGSAARSYEVGLVQKLPWIGCIGSDTGIADACTQVADLKRRADLHDESCRLFSAPAVMPDLLAGNDFHTATANTAGRHGAEHLRILDMTHRVEKHIHELAQIDATAESYLDSEVGPHPSDYQQSPIDEDALRQLLQKPIGKVISGITERRGGARAVANLTYSADRRLEVIAHGLERPPAQIEAFRRKHRILPHDKLGDSAADVLSYLVGLAFGRWDARVAGADQPELGGLFDPVLVHPPGMLLHDGRPARTTPPGYELQLPPGQLLLDQLGHPWDFVGRITAAASVLVEDADRLITDLLPHLRGRSRDLRHHLRKRFFKAHLRRYSKSRRKAPIYWPLYTPSGVWGVWVYAPSLTRETLYAVEAAATARLNATQAEISRLTRSQEKGSGARPVQETAKALAAEQLLAEELGVFRGRVEQIAGLGWEPDLDDGIVLCAAPLADVFPAWPEAAKKRENIRAGKYPWASVSKWADEI